MAGDKVRLYDLAKEMHLEGKDVLAACDQQAIAYKSISSTINASEAEILRSILSATARPKSSDKSPEKNSEKPAKPQQILSISQQKPQKVLTPAPNKAAVKPETKPDASPEPKPKLEVKPEPAPALQTKPQIATPTAPPAKPVRPSKPVLPAPTTSVKPKPPEPIKPASDRHPERKPERKVVLQQKPEIAPPQPRTPKPVKNSVLIERGITAPTDPPRPLRQTTPPPARPVEAVKPAKNKEKDKETVEDTVSVVEFPPLIDRPVNKLANKKLKKRSEEEVELLEMQERANRSKSKKHLRLFSDDEDEVDYLIHEDNDEIPQVALSLLRPSARPKASAPKAEAFSKPHRKGSSPSRERHSHPSPEVAEPVKPTKVNINDTLTVAELAEKLMVSETQIIRTLFMKGVMVTINQSLEVATAKQVAEELGYEVEQVAEESAARKLTEMLDVADLDNLQRRPPVVTIMGHVDHGKTTLLDAIRKTKVAQGEAGGITQHIGAYHVDVDQGGTKQQVVFLDTPGHAAFTAMRARGARVTDVAVLVVAADDGVQPQTIEAISHARAAKVPIIVAINKIDKPEAQPDRIRQELAEHGLVDEAWGGDTIMVPVSAIKGENLDTLLEMILLVAEVEDLHANPNRPAKGTVIEAHLDKARGPVATLLVQNGTLRVGDVLVAGSVLGKVRAMVDDRGDRVESATPSFAVEVLGLSEVPDAGDEFEVFLDEKQARAVASERAEQSRQNRLQALASRRISLSSASAKAQEGDLKELNIILKADVQGSVEAITNALKQLPQSEVQLCILLAAPGEITENDVVLAAASDAVILGFNTTLATGARTSADELGVDIREYNIIYNLLEDVQGAMEGLLEPELVEEHLGIAEVRAIFPVGRSHKVAGCYVQSGKLVRNCRVRIRRGKELVFEGTLDSLKRMKDDVKEVATGFECGVGLAKFNDWQEGDTIEAFRMVTKRRTLTSN
jgi:translation initiation factor IF-2